MIPAAPGPRRRPFSHLAVALLLVALPAGIACPASGADADTQPAANGTKTPAKTEPKPAAKAPAQAPAAGPPVPKTLEPLTKDSIGVLGTKVQGPNGEDMGLVVDVIVDGEGRPRALVIDFGGFLGVGSRKIAIDWRLVHFKPGAKDAPVLLRLGRAEIQAAPEYDPASPNRQMVGPPKTEIPASTNVGK